MGKNKKKKPFSDNAKRKEGLKEIGQGYKQWLVDGSKKAAIGGFKGAVDGFTSGTGLPDKIVKAATGMVTKGVGGAFKDVAQGTMKASKGILKAIFNDLSWYENYPELIKGMAGANLCIDDSKEISYNGVGSAKESKGLIATHSVTMTNGSSEKMRHMAIQKIYESLRRANSGSVNYTEANINDFYIEVRNIIALASELKRGYGLTNTYTSANLAVPNLYLTALGLDAQDFLDHSANIREYLNKLAKRLSVYVPLNLPILKRTDWMFGTVFNDSDDIKAQKHAFALTEWLHYDLASSSWKITTKSIYAPITSTQLIALIEAEFAALVKCCPAGTIAGDMIKAFGINALYQFGTVDESYQTPTGYSEEVLTQIQNEVHPPRWTTVPAVDNYGLNYLRGYSAALLGDGTSSALQDVQVRDLNEPSINFYKNDVPNVELIAATRLIVSAQETVTKTSSNIELHYGTEVITAVSVFFLSNGVVSYTTMATYVKGDASTMGSVIARFKAWSVIDWMPRINVQLDYYNGSGSALRTSVVDVWDYNNSGFLSILSMESMHDVACASLYYVPLLAKAQPNLQELKA